MDEMIRVTLEEIETLKKGIEKREKYLEELRASKVLEKGDSVKIISQGFVYTTYVDAVIELAQKAYPEDSEKVLNIIKRYNYELNPNKLGYYKVVSTISHFQHNLITLALISDFLSENYYLVDVEGLQYTGG